MTPLPPTLSRDVKELFTPRISEGAVVNKLKGRPELLLKFFKQATQSYAWSFRNKQLLIALMEVFRDRLLDRSFAWSLIESAYFNAHLTFIQLAILAYPDLVLSADIRFSRLMMMKECAKLREEWMKTPNMAPGSADIAFYITLEEAHTLYKTMVTGAFWQYQRETLESLQNHLLQASKWGYARGVEELQNLIIEYVDESPIILGVYVFAMEYGFKKLQEYCKEAIDHFDYFESEHRREKRLSLVDIFWDLSVTSGIWPENRAFKKCRLQSLLSSTGSTLSKLTIVRLTMFKFEDTEGRIVRISHRYINAGEFDMEEFRKAPRVKFDASRIDRIISDGNHRLPDLALAGFLLYCRSCSSLWLSDYAEVKLPDLMVMAKARPDLRSLTIDTGVMDESVLLEIPACFAEITFLNICRLNLEAKTLTILMNSKLISLSFPKCRVTLPDDLSDFSRLQSIDISYVETLEELEILRLLASTLHLTDLGVVNTKNFHPGLVVHPEHLEEIIVGPGLMDGGDKTLFDRFRKLSKIIVIGSLTPNGKILLAHFLRERSNIQFKFFPAGKKD